MFPHYELAQLRAAELIREADHHLLLNQAKRARAAERGRRAETGRNHASGRSLAAHVLRLLATAFSLSGGAR